ncbi:MAG: ester cyclase [Pseudomonadota bacterium]
MQGFEDRFEDFTDYILTITREIWEERGLGAKMRAYYHPDVIVRTPGGVSIGEPASTSATMATLTEFPDRVLLGEDVIWSGTPELGMLSSHRIVSTATHRGGAFGPATGKRVTWRAFADCWAKDNVIADEWLIRDNGALVRQLGHDPRDWVAARLAAGEAGTPLTPETDVTGPYVGKGNDHEAGARYADLLTSLMGAEFSVIPAEWDRACHLSYPGGVIAHGHAAADAFWMGLRSSFPSAQFAVQHVIGRDDPLMPPRAALRFSLTGVHAGWGAFGAPTGAEVHVMGIAHAELGPRGLRREWVIFDETAIWTQILSAVG